MRSGIHEGYCPQAHCALARRAVENPQKMGDLKKCVSDFYQSNLVSVYTPLNFLFTNALVKMTDLIEQIRDFLLSDPQLSQKMERIELSDGQMLFQQGDPDSAFYLIQSGRIRIYTCDGDGKELAIATLGVGQTSGELALIDGQPHFVTAVSLGSSVLQRLSRDDFLKRAYNSTQLSQLLIQLGNQRLRYLIDYTKRLKEWMHLVVDSQCDRVIEDLEDFDVEGDGVTKSGYLAGILSKVADSFKDIAQTVRQLKGSECQLEIKLKLEINEDRHQQQVEEIVNAEYFSYLVELAERRNTVSNTQNSGENKDKVLSFNKSGIKHSSKVNSLQNPEIKQALIRGLRNRSEVFNRLILKAWSDEQFKQKLLANPKAVCAQEFGYEMPDNLAFEVIEETLDAIKIVLPVNPFLKIAESELSEEVLDAIAGGNWNINNNF